MCVRTYGQMLWYMPRNNCCPVVRHPSSFLPNNKCLARTFHNVPCVCVSVADMLEHLARMLSNKKKENRIVNFMV